MIWNDLAMVLDMVEKACVMAVFAYGLFRSPFFQHLFEKQRDWQQQLTLGGIFVLFSCYGIYSGLLVDGFLVALSRPGPILAGLLAGPLLGSGVGLVTAGIRFTQGGDEIWAATAAPLVAGILAGYYRQWRGRPVFSVREAVIFTAAFELAARIFPVLAAANIAQSIKAQMVILLPMLSGNAIMVAFFIFVTNVLREERKNRSIQARMEGELLLARDIQLSLVPALPAIFPYLPNFSLHALLEPAREVGGDLYDFFYLDEERFCFVIGDVSGKGMSAALFMSATRTLFKAQADREFDTGEILRRVNDELCRGNDASMFVTLFCGILNVRNGQVIYSNAGHNPPYLLRAGKGLECLPARHGAALGVMEGLTYGSGELTLAVGDALVLYTDGVTEAMNIHQEMFETWRLEQALLQVATLDPHLLLATVMEQVRQFTVAAEQSDDITMLALRLDGGAN